MPLNTIQEAHQKIKSRQYADAELTLKSFLESTPYHTEATKLLVIAKKRRGDTEGAIQLLHSLDHKSYPDKYTDLGWAHFETNEFAQSKSYFERALRLDNRSEGAHQGLVASLRKLQDFESAQRQLDAALILFSDSNGLAKEQAWIHYEAGDYNRALMDFYDLVDRYPNDPSIRYWIIELSTNHRKALLAHTLRRGLDGISFDVAIYMEHAKDEEDLRDAALVLSPRLALRRDGSVLSMTQRWIAFPPDVIERLTSSENVALSEIAPLLSGGPPDTVTFFKSIFEEEVSCFRLLHIDEGSTMVASILLGTRTWVKPSTKNVSRFSSERLEAAGREILATIRMQRQSLIDSVQTALTHRRDPSLIANLLVKILADEFDWDLVAIWRVEDEFILVAKCDHTPDGSFTAIPKRQALTGGMLGETLRQQAALWANDVTTTPPPYNYIRPNTALAVRSTLFFPILVGDRVEWILECASTEYGAFRGADSAILRRVLAHVQSTLDFWFAYKLSDAIFNGIEQCVIVIDRSGTIQRGNEAAYLLFGYDILDRSVFSIICAESHDEFRPLRTRRNTRVLVNTTFGHSQLKLATIHVSDDLFGRWVLQLSDPDDQQIIAGLQYAKATVEELAAKVRGPLMLARALVERVAEALREGANTRAEAAQLSRAVDNLRRVDLTYERLTGALSGSEQTELRTMLDSVAGTLPRALSRRIEYVEPIGSATIATGLADATKVFRQLLLRTFDLVGEGKPIRLATEVRDQTVAILVGGLEKQDRALLAAQENANPLQAVESAARDSVGARNVPLVEARAALAVEGWALEGSTSDLEVIIPLATDKGPFVEVLNVRETPTNRR